MAENLAFTIFSESPHGRSAAAWNLKLKSLTRLPISAPKICPDTKSEQDNYILYLKNVFSMGFQMETLFYYIGIFEEKRQNVPNLAIRSE